MRIIQLYTVVFFSFTIHISSCTSCTRLTWANVGLVSGVRHYQERRFMVPEALADQDSDVYCLGEVWLESDMRLIINALASSYPHHYSAIHHREGQLSEPASPMDLRERINPHATVRSPCSVSDMMYFKQKVATCARRNGCMAAFSQSAGLGAECLTQKCKEELQSEQLRPGCISCLALMFSSFGSAMEACAPNPSETKNKWNGPGLLMLSKRPLENVEYTSLWPDNDPLIERGYLQADVQGLGKVVCTHLTVDGPYYTEYDMDFPNYQLQQRAEIDKIHDRFGTMQHWLVGDLNTGPKRTSLDPEKILKGELPTNYEYLMSKGYHNHYFTLDGRCTYCSENPLVDYPNNVLDHILLYNSNHTVKYMKRVFDQYETSPISDHFGLEIKVCQD